VFKKYYIKHPRASLEKDLFPSLVGKGLYGYCCSGNFIDIGTPDSLIRAKNLFSENTNSF